MVHSAANLRRPRWALSQRSVDTSSEAHTAAAGSSPDAQSGLVSDGSTRGRAPQTACARKAPTPRLSTSDGDSFWTASQVINRTAASLLSTTLGHCGARATYQPTNTLSGFTLCFTAHRHKALLIESRVSCCGPLLGPRIPWARGLQYCKSVIHNNRNMNRK